MGKDDDTDSAGRAAAPPKRKRQRVTAAAAADEDNQEQRPAARSCPDTSTAATVHWAAAFPAAHVKKILQDGEPEIGGLLQPATRLITACSALFVRNLVQQSNSITSSANSNLEALRQAVAAEPLLEGVLDGLEEDGYNQSSGSLLTSAEWKQSSRSKAKKPPPPPPPPASDRKKQQQQANNKQTATKATKHAAAVDDGLVEEALKIAGDSSAGMGIIPTNNRQEVVLDEEDYD